jgi:hypothetical protein
MMNIDPSLRQIAFMDQETDECGERRWNYSDGGEKFEKFYRELKQRGVSVGMGTEVTGCSHWFGRLPAGRGFKVWIGDAAEIERMRVRMLRHRRGCPVELNRARPLRSAKLVTVTRVPAARVIAR